MTFLGLSTEKKALGPNGFFRGAEKEGGEKRRPKPALRPPKPPAGARGGGVTGEEVKTMDAKTRERRLRELRWALHGVLDGRELKHSQAEQLAGMVETLDAERWELMLDVLAVVGNTWDEEWPLDLLR